MIKINLFLTFSEKMKKHLKIEKKQNAELYVLMVRKYG